MTAAGALFQPSGAVSVNHPSAGVYEINWNQSVRGCTFLATAGDDANIMQEIGSERYAGPPEQVRVVEYDIFGVPENGGFDIGVFC